MFIRECKACTRVPKNRALALLEPFEDQSTQRQLNSAGVKPWVHGQMFGRTGGWGCPLDLHGYDRHSRPHRLQRPRAGLLMICGERKEEWLTAELASEAPRRQGLSAQSTGETFFCYWMFPIMRSWLLLLLKSHLMPNTTTHSGLI